MTAGESADEHAKRMRERARRLEQRADNFERGAEGERRIGAVLDGLPAEYLVYHDIRLPPPSRANVDHLVVGPNRVVAVDTKNYSSPVTIGRGRGAGKLWTGRRPIDSVTSCKWEASVVSGVIGLPVDPVMCIIAPSLPSSKFDFDGLRVCSPGRLVEEVTRAADTTVDVAYAQRALQAGFGVVPADRRPPEIAITGRQSPPSQLHANVTAPAPSRRSRSRSTRPSGQGRSPVASTRPLLQRPWFRMLLLVMGALLLMAILPTIMDGVSRAGQEAGERIAEQLPTVPTVASTSSTTSSTSTTTTSVPPASTQALTIIGAPTASAGRPECGATPGTWTLAFVWPGEPPSGVAGYGVQWRLNGGDFVDATPGVWTEPSTAPVSLGVDAGQTIEVVTEHLSDDGALLSSRAEEIAPPTGCP